MLDECDARIKNKTWELVPLPANVNIIRCMWIFSHKEDSNGVLQRHKARFVGDDRSQHVETFISVVKSTSIRCTKLFLNLEVFINWRLKNAFLHGHLPEIVYMHQPVGFRDSTHRSLFMALELGITYFADVATTGFSHSTSDHSLFIYHKGKDMTYLLLYVDDCYNGRERETNYECKNNKNRQQIYVVHQFGYIHGRERENILLCEENQITERK